MAITSPARLRRTRAAEPWSRSSAQAYTPAAANPTAWYVAMVECAASGPKLGLSSTASGSACSSEPSGATSKPTGLCIQALAATTIVPENAAATATGTPHHQWTAGRSRCQPNRYRPRKIASRKKA
jgi:hypothetical protein